jgi:radical SAM pair-associated protein
MHMTPRTFTLTYVVDNRIFDKDVVQKCFYWYTGDYEVYFSILNDNQQQITLHAKSDEIIDEDLLKLRINTDLNDYQLRAIVSQETNTIRELIIAKAFANFDDEEINHQYEISDPVGFNPRV